MVAVVTGSGRLTVTGTQTNTVGLIAPLTYPVSVATAANYSNGTAANQVDLLYSKPITLTGATTTIDLSALLDVAGGAINMTRVREIVFDSTETTLAKIVKISAGATNGWAFLPPAASFLTLTANGTFYMSDALSVGAGVGYVVTGTSKTILLDPGAQTILINVLIMGCSAVS